MSKPTKYNVIELFGPTIQGEGALAGCLTHFIRLGGCGYRCSWCDSMHAVDPVRVKNNRLILTAKQIGEGFDKRPYVPWITISGGDPVLHDCTELIEELQSRHFEVALETQAQFWRDWLLKLDFVTISPKPPSSGMETDWDVLNEYLFRLPSPARGFCVKIVLFNDDDIRYAEEVHKRMLKYGWGLQVSMYLSVGTIQSGVMPVEKAITDGTNILLQKLPETSLADDKHVRLLPQVHTLLWGREHGH